MEIFNGSTEPKKESLGHGIFIYLMWFFNNAMFTIPKITINGWYRPFPNRWFIIVLTTLFIYLYIAMLQWMLIPPKKNHATWLKFWLLHMFVIWPKSKKSLADWDKMNECPNSDGGISNLRRKGGGFTTKNDQQNDCQFSLPVPSKPAPLKYQNHPKPWCFNRDPWRWSKFSSAIPKKENYVMILCWIPMILLQHTSTYFNNVKPC